MIWNIQTKERGVPMKTKLERFVADSPMDGGVGPTRPDSPMDGGVGPTR